MSAKDLAKKASLENTEVRIDTVTNRQTKLESAALPTKYQGHDPQTGTAKFSRGGDCCECNIISGGDLITTGAIGVGEVALCRPTEGNIRLDKRGSTSSPTECGSGGAPNPRRFGGAVDDDGETTSTFLYPCPPAGTRVFGSTRFVGLAEIYEIYTGEKVGDPLVFDGTTKEINKICAQQTVTIPNSPSAQNPTKPYAGINDDGCVQPTDAPTGNLKRCQWYDSTEADALAGIGAPEGMFFSGYVEYPEGVFRILACTEDGEPATDEGTGFDWNPANVTESGAAIESTNYCSSSATAELRWDGGSITTENPPISYSFSYSLAGTSDTLYLWSIRSRIFTSAGTQVFDFVFTVYSFDEPIILPIYNCAAENRSIQNVTIRGMKGTSPPRATCGGIIDAYDGLGVCGTVETFVASLWWVSGGRSYPFTAINTIEGSAFAAECGGGGDGFTVSDSTGVIATYEYEPTNIVYTCRSNTPNC